MKRRRTEKTLAAFSQLSNAGALEPLRQQRIAKGGRIVEVSVIASALVNEAGEKYGIATTERVVAT